MHPQHIDAAVEGNIEHFKENSGELELMETPSCKNTILHINIMSQDGSSTKFVEDILNRWPSLLLRVNAKGETPLHFAAKWGKSDMVEILIKQAKAQREEYWESGIEATKLMLRMTNNDGNTALHEAVQYEHLEVVKILTKEDPDFTYASNNRGETPLYIATVKESLEMVVEILETCTSPAHEGPNQMTALHAAAMCRNSEMTSKLLKRKMGLIKETDQYGWTPLHYAAYFCNPNVIRVLLNHDISAVYIKDKHRKMTPLLLAASQGYIANEIISRCPDCCELVDERGWTVLHFAMLSLGVESLKVVLKSQPLKNLATEKDVDGNTPLHLLAAIRPDLLCGMVFGRDKVKGLQSKVNEVDKQNMISVSKIVLSGSPQLKQEILKLGEAVEPYRHGVVRVAKQRKHVDEDYNEEYVKKANESHLIVAALIATVTFTAAFTLPGGVIQEGPDKGNAILSKRSAFQAFVITDAIAMVLSLSAVFAHFLLSTVNASRHFIFLYEYAYLSTLIAIGAMEIAFVTATFAVLTTTLWLAIVTCLIGLTFFIFAFLFFKGIAQAMKAIL